MAQCNPFTPTFGQVPVTMAGRSDFIADVLEGLENGPGDPNRATIFIGARGTGKTVLLSSITHLAEQRGWISINVTANESMLDEILVQSRARADHLISPESKTRVTGLSFSGTGVSLAHNKRLTTWRSEFTELVQEINNAGVGVLLTIDEAYSGCASLATVSDVFQHFVREGRNVALLMAGLPQQVSLLLQDEGVTFLRRSFQRQLGSIAFGDVVSSMRETIEGSGRSISTEALLLAADATQGFAYMIQLVGYEMWRQHPEENEISMQDVEFGIKMASKEMDRSVFIPTLRSLTGREVGFLVALANVERPAKTTTIAQKLGISDNNAGNIRRRLLEQGILEEVGRSQIDFQIPFFAEHLRDAYSE